MTVSVKYYVLRVKSSLNAIVGCTTLSKLQAVVSIPHLKMKFPTDYGIGESRSDQSILGNYFVRSPGFHPNKDASKDKEVETLVTVDTAGSTEANKVITLQLEPCERYSQSIAESVDDMEEVELIPGWPDRNGTIGSGLPAELCLVLVQLLQEYGDVFAYTPYEMPGIDENIAVHKLSVNPGHKPVRQKRKNMARDQQKIVDENVDKLLKAGFIYEIEYADWVANIVLVKKHSEKWRMCIDYIDLNKTWCIL